jgi:prepilin-type N-terminal cleavage/methylation domain-containing protein
MKNSGFTLLELIISIAITGLIVLIITGALGLGFRSIDSGEGKIEAIERIRSSFNIVDSQIQSELPLTYFNEDAENKYFFKGEETLMQFPTNYSIWGGERGYVIATYSVETEADGKQALYVSEHFIGVDYKRDTKLFDSFDRIYFEYFYKDPTEEEGTWVNEWTDDTNIPEKVILHLIMGRRDFSMIIPYRSRGTLSPTPARSEGFLPTLGEE